MRVVEPLKPPEKYEGLVKRHVPTVEGMHVPYGQPKTPLDRGTPEGANVPVHVESPHLTTHEAAVIRKILLEQAKRDIEALRLYHPIEGEWSDFHDSKSKVRIIRGSNRSGKTLLAAVELARAATGQSDRYPMKDGRAYVVGKDGKEIGEVLYRKLFRAGAFRIIRDYDPPYGWRVFRPNDPMDAVREREAKPAPPLIPPRFIVPDGIAWENKRLNIPNKITLSTGWEISFYPSGAKPPHGSDIDYAWFDEEIEDPDWLPEIMARLTDRNGSFVWSATPQAGTEQLYTLHEKALMDSTDKNPLHSEFITLIAKNPYISEKSKKEFAEALPSDDERRVRIDGVFARLSYLVFPEYSKEVHRESYFEIPSNWTRYVAIDPGRQICAGLFAAVPPPGKGDHVYFYDEFYIKDCNSELFAQEMKSKCREQQIYAFIIDYNQARVVEMASGMSIDFQYSQALKRHNVRSVATGYGFLPGSGCYPGAVKPGIEACRDWLWLRDGKPKLRVFSDKCKHFEEEIVRYPYERKEGKITDDPQKRGPVHLMACFRYLALNRCPYREPVARPRAKSGAALALQKKRDRLAEKRLQGPREYVRLGPGETHPDFYGGG